MIKGLISIFTADLNLGIMGRTCVVFGVAVPMILSMATVAGMGDSVLEVFGTILTIIMTVAFCVVGFIFIAGGEK